MAVWAVLLGHAALWMLVLHTRRLPVVAGSEARRSLVLHLVPQPRPVRERAARVEARQPAATSPGISLRQPPALPAAGTPSTTSD